MASTKDLLLITGASGKQGTAILTHLAPKWNGRLRLQCQSDSSAERLKEKYPSAEVVAMNLKTASSAKKLLENVTYAYLLTPGMHPDELTLGMTFIEAAIQSHRSDVLKHLVFASVIHAQLTSLINHKNKLEMEEVIIESGMPYTIVQPTHFMDNIPIGHLQQQAKENDTVIFDAIFKPDTKISFAALSDVGEAVSNIFLDPEKYVYGIYEIVSTAKPLSYDEVMAIASEVLGKKVEVKPMTVDQGIEFFGKFAIPQDMDAEGRKVMSAGFEAMIRHYEKPNAGGLVGNSLALGMILGRPGVGVRVWMERQIS
ncbi:hypothetical protein HII31_10359 [Pseudocercospora fuligena]|uniref:NmrA-like domain-containing protein n=1 Tax=Pseudocercospora fuligena TaxID=685502 RepID=A0A8H6RAG5_9PEZI|nr:hypothetical protein HII31_10359 [Pseudocercospora fuligena]